MPRKGMRNLLFCPKKAITSSPSSISNSHLSNPRLIFSDAIADRSLMIAEEMITKWDPDVSTFAKVTSLFYENRREAMEFIKCVNELQKSMHFLVIEDPYTDKLKRGNELMKIAMKRLQKEFYQILSTNRAHLDPESVSAKSSRTSTQSSMSDFDDEDDEIRVAEDSISEVKDVSNVAMVDLRSIAECMIGCGYGKECMTIYKLIRKSIIDEGIYKLGVQKMSLSHVRKKEWHALEINIKIWLEAVKIAMKTLFHGEKILCDHIFASSENIKDSCFSHISNEGATILFVFPEIVAKNSKKSPEKLLRLLDMYVAISNNWPEINTIFSSQSSFAVRSQAVNSLIKISEFVRMDIKDFECVLQKDASKSLVGGGGIHPLTVQTLNYVIRLANYNNVLTDILAGYSLLSRSSLPESLFNVSNAEDSETTTISHVFAWLVLVLLCKLDTKSKHYNDVSLAYLFLANNLQHIVTKVRTSNLKYFLDENWLTNHESKIKQFATNYERLAWDHVIQSLPEKPKEEISKEDAMKGLVRFNIAFEQAHRKQSVCIVPDINLRDAIKVSVAEKIVPVYREFYYNKHIATLSNRSIYTSVVKFTPEDVANWLSDLYFVTTGSGPSPNSSHSRTSFPR